MVSAVESPSLVLNRNWNPVNVTPAGEALSMMFREVAQTVNTDTYELFEWENWSAIKPKDGDRFIQAVRFRVLVPEVIVLRTFDRLPTSIVTFNRRQRRQIRQDTKV